MTRKIFILSTLLCGFFMFSYAQQDASNLKINAQPKDQWEVGIHAGHTLLAADVDWSSSFGAGLHVRKSLDYIFSLRLDAGYYSMSGMEEDASSTRSVDGANYGFGAWQPEYSTTAITGDLSVITK